VGQRKVQRNNLQRKVGMTELEFLFNPAFRRSQQKQKTKQNKKKAPMKIIKKLTFAALAATLLFQAPITQAAPKYSDWSAPVNLGPVINSGFEEFHTAVSKNGLSLYFGSDRPGGFSAPGEDQADIYVSQRASVDDPWGAPVNLGPTINSAWGDGRPSLSRDEHLMFFQSNRPGGPGGADIWVSWRQHTHDDFGWQPPVILGSGVNSDAIDAGPTYFENEGGAPQLYFNSSRLGGNDIFVSELMADGSFGPAQLVTELSGPTVDAQPSIRHDGLEIFFQSNRAGSLDLWVSTRETTLDPWSTPVKLGDTINTDYDERFPFVSSDGETLYFTSGRPGGFGALDLYMSTRTKLRGRSAK
jgi:hypothetical protein